jgi:ribonuclease Z
MEQCYWSKHPKHAIKGTNYSLIGYSVAARNTGFYIPELRIALDCGVPNDHTPEHIFITHGHLDHCNCVPSTIMDTGKVCPNIYAHKFFSENLKNFIHYAYVLSKNNPNPKIHHKYTLNSLDYDDEIFITVCKRKWKVKVIKCFHNVPCVGYGFYECRTKLKPEFVGLEQRKIEEIKNSGVEITYSIEVPQFCFLGDTNEFVLSNPILKDFKTIMLECSFLYDEHIKEAEDHRHIHWTKISKFIQDNPEITFVLYHFSFRYTNEEIAEFFNKVQCPVEIDGVMKNQYFDNIVVWT